MDLIHVLKWLLNGFELAATVAGFCYLSKWKSSYWKWFPWLMLFTLATELVAKYMGRQPGLGAYNYMVYRYLNIPVTVLFYLWLFYRSFVQRHMHILIVVIAGIYATAWLAEELAGDPGLRQWGAYSYAAGFAGLLVLAITWLSMLVRRREVLYFKQNMHFWVCAGLLVYYIVTLPFRLMLIPLYENFPDVADVYLHVTYFFNYIMYTSFIIGFKWAKPESSYPL